jgi:chromate transporter
LSSALTGITAAVVGVIANLGLYFAVHTLFATTDTATAGPLQLQLQLPQRETAHPAVACN